MDSIQSAIVSEFKLDFLDGLVIRFLGLTERKKLFFELKMPSRGGYFNPTFIFLMRNQSKLESIQKWYTS